MSASTPEPGQPIISDFAGDPDMAELVDEFVSEMPSRTDTLRRALGAKSVEELKRCAHQIKGAAGGYGFPSIGASAAKLEAMMKSLSPSSFVQQIEAVRATVNELVDLCRRASARR